MQQYENNGRTWVSPFIYLLGFMAVILFWCPIICLFSFAGNLSPEGRGVTEKYESISPCGVCFFTVGDCAISILERYR